MTKNQRTSPWFVRGGSHIRGWQSHIPINQWRLLLLRNLTNSGLSYCSRSIFSDPRPVGLHQVGGVMCYLRFELKLLIFSHQSTLHLQRNGTNVTKSISTT